MQILFEVISKKRPAVLPLPANNNHLSYLLASNLRAEEKIDDDIAVVIPTSGTTGKPKGAMLTADSLKASAEASHAYLGGKGQWLLALPICHIAGLQVMIRSIISSTIPVILPVDFKPYTLISAINSLTGNRRYASMVAVQLHKTLHNVDAVSALASLNAVLIGGGPISNKLMERASSLGINIIHTYGMSETSGGCIYNGTALNGVSLRIENSRVLIGGPLVAKGYRNAINSNPFISTNWFCSNDLGIIENTGKLRIIGRADESINTGGLTIVPQLVESVINTHPSINACVVFGIPDKYLGERVAVAILLTPRTPIPKIDEIQKYVTKTLDITATPREMYIVKKLPYNSLGKINRSSLAQTLVNRV